MWWNNSNNRYNRIMKCQCEQAGYCPIFDKIMGGRNYEICKSDHPKAETYRQNWLKLNQEKKWKPIIEYMLKHAPKEVVDFLISLKKYTDSGSPKISDADYKLRTEKCDQCEHNKGGSCELCGCFIALKASWPTEECPAHKWPTLPVINAAKSGCGCGVSNNR